MKGNKKNNLMHNKKIAWEVFFKVIGIDRTKLIDPSNSADKRALGIIYSAETFLFSTMNKACRDKDLTKTLTLGPFSHALQSTIMHSDTDSNDNKPFTVHRGIQITKKEF